ncbi:Deoxynucleotidyltransferase terminal-interacting protein 2 [Sciurus carolinensis]|uniref:Deoxynucleotidyltransferase terminal-interacting protein 2 n=1 Tax=Sciurus carolinensis TaxID=30640 RepID=A0AA41T4V7_SCICA|nr:Deoxynucleotidyltransferase terminal-interacting protein 2 [Sciurus carolinensis]
MSESRKSARWLGDAQIRPGYALEVTDEQKHGYEGEAAFEEQEEVREQVSSEKAINQAWSAESLDLKALRSYYSSSILSCSGAHLHLATCTTLVLSRQHCRLPSAVSPLRVSVNTFAVVEVNRWSEKRNSTIKTSDITKFSDDDEESSRIEVSEDNSKRSESLECDIKLPKSELNTSQEIGDSVLLVLSSDESQQSEKSGSEEDTLCFVENSGQKVNQNVNFRKKRRKERQKTAGDGWFGMKAPELTDELKNYLKALKMRASMVPKRFYKKNDRDGFPKYFQVGTVVDNPADFYHSGIPKKQRKRTIVEELLADSEFRKYNRRNYTEIMAEKAANAAGKKVL